MFLTHFITGSLVIYLKKVKLGTYNSQPDGTKKTWALGCMQLIKERFYTKQLQKKLHLQKKLSIGTVTTCIREKISHSFGLKLDPLVESGMRVVIQDAARL